VLHRFARELAEGVFVGGLMTVIIFTIHALGELRGGEEMAKSEPYVQLSNREKLQIALRHADIQAGLRAKGLPVWTEDECQALIAHYQQLVDEEECLRALPVPASFTGRIPDTPEARAARAQLLASKGKDPRPSVCRIV